MQFPPGHQSQMLNGHPLCGLCITTHCGRAVAAGELDVPSSASGLEGDCQSIAHHHQLQQGRMRERTKSHPLALSFPERIFKILASSAAALRLVNGSLSHMVWELFKMLLLLWFLGQVSSHKPFKRGFSVPYSSLVLLDILPLVCKAKDFGDSFLQGI